MTKTISLADDAYDLLVSVKQPGESFSEVARRLARAAALDEVFHAGFRLGLTDQEAEDWKRSVYAARDEDRKPRVRFR